MPNTIFLESGTSATQDTNFYNGATAGTVASATDQFFTSPRSLKLSTGAGAVTASIIRLACLADAGRRISFRFRFDTVPAAQSNVLRFLTSAGVALGSIRLNTTGALSFNQTAATTGTTILKVNQWYRISIGYTITSATVYTYNVFLNGKLEVTQSNAGSITTGTSGLSPTISSAAGANVNFWFDDIYVDDGTTLDDPGNIIITNKRPFSNGAANNWTTQIGSGGSGYGSGHAPQVNEQPLSTTNGWSIASASLVVEEYTIEGASVGDNDISRRDYAIVDYMGWVFFKSGTADTRNIIVNGAASNITTTTAFAMYLKAAGSTTYPSGNTAIGMDNNSLVALASLGEAGILLAVKLPRRISTTP